jgi:hypothetical protein
VSEWRPLEACKCRTVPLTRRWVLQLRRSCKGLVNQGFVLARDVHFKWAQCLCLYSCWGWSLVESGIEPHHHTSLLLGGSLILTIIAITDRCISMDRLSMNTLLFPLDLCTLSILPVPWSSAHHVAYLRFRSWLKFANARIQKSEDELFNS